MLAARVATAVALVGALLAALFLLPPFALTLLFAGIAALGAHEWARLCGLARALGAAYTGFVGGAVVAAASLGAAYPFIGVGVAFWVLIAPQWLWRGVEAGHRTPLAIAGLAVLIPAGLAMTVMTPVQLLLSLILIWVADTAAYFTGRRFGRRKLAPAISPGKTWEGVWGAVAAVLLYALLCRAFNEQLSAVTGALWVAYLAAAVVLCALSILGDLFESALKRQAGAKDSGKLLPGHGGVLDRIDSATATLPFAAGLWVLLGGK